AGCAPEATASSGCWLTLGLSCPRTGCPTDGWVGPGPLGSHLRNSIALSRERVSSDQRSRGAAWGKRTLARGAFVARGKWRALAWPELHPQGPRSGEVE